MKLKDTATQVNCPTSRFLTKEELMKGADSTHPTRMNFIFRHGIPLSVRDDHAKVLMKKYPTIQSFYDEKKPKKVKKVDGFEGKSYKELQKIAREKGYSFKETMVKKDVLLEMLKEK